MPKVYLTRQQELNERLVSLIYGTMKVKHITQAQMAERLGIKQQSFSKKLKRAQFTFSDLFTIFEMLELSDELILSVMRVKRGAQV